jgi:acyl-CoA thioester hydrolase
VAAFVHRIRVRYNECDAQGAVFNANYLVYFDVTITELWREACGSYGYMETLGVDLVVAESNVGYYKPARFDDEIEVVATFEKLGNTSIVTHFDVMRGDERLTEGTLRHVVIDTTGAKTPIPDELRAKLEPYS